MVTGTSKNPARNEKNPEAQNLGVVQSATVRGGLGEKPAAPVRSRREPSDSVIRMPSGALCRASPQPAVDGLRRDAEEGGDLGHGQEALRHSRPCRGGTILGFGRRSGRDGEIRRQAVQLAGPEVTQARSGGQMGEEGRAVGGFHKGHLRCCRALWKRRWSQAQPPNAFLIVSVSGLPRTTRAERVGLPSCRPKCKKPLTQEPRGRWVRPPLKAAGGDGDGTGLQAAVAALPGLPPSARTSLTWSVLAPDATSRPSPGSTMVW